jgi:hypothetical protein
MGGVGGVGAIGAGAPASAASPASGGPAKAGPASSPSSVVKLSSEGQAMSAGQPTQARATEGMYSAKGIQQTSGVDSSTSAKQAVHPGQNLGLAQASETGAGGADACCNANGQSYAELNKMNPELLAALMLLLLTTEDKTGSQLAVASLSEALGI